MFVQASTPCFLIIFVPFYQYLQHFGWEMQAILSALDQQRSLLLNLCLIFKNRIMNLINGSVPPLSFSFPVC